MVLDNRKLGAPEEETPLPCAVYEAISVYNVPWVQSEYDVMLKITKGCVSRKLFIVK